MGNLYQNFTEGKMDKDSDERLIKKGFFRHAENVLIVQSEGSDVGAIQNAYSNKKLTNIDFGTNALCIGIYCDEAEDKIYWFVVSDSGCYLLEYNIKNEIASFVLVDTRTVGSRVLNLSKDYLITGIVKITSEDPKKSLFLWTDDNIESCCINIERAKTWGANNFEAEDILLIKKPPRYAPKLTPININSGSNNIEKKFISFSYRYKYIDGEYSALSSYTNYSFAPKGFQLDYYILQNKGMLNSFNAVNIQFNTGGKNVTDIQLVAKESNSNNLPIIETFNKENEGWGDNQNKTYQFSNSKLHSSLPAKELYRAFDNVPLKAKALTLIGNRAILGNYLEGRNMVDANNAPVFMNYELSLIQQPLVDGKDFDVDFTANVLTFSNPDGIELKEGNRITFHLVLYLAGVESYSNEFFYLLPEDYASIAAAFDTDLFRDFIAIIQDDLQNNYQFDTAPPKDGYVEFIKPTIVVSVSGSDVLLTFTPVTFKDSNASDAEVVENFTVDTLSTVVLNSYSTSSSLKSFRDYEVGFLYLDNYNRATTTLTTPYNTIFIPLKYSVFKNKIQVKVNNLPPAWADRFKVVLKSKPLAYEVIYVNKFYNEDLNVWCKLEGDNKDKVKENDVLILKTSNEGAVTSLNKVTVLEVKSQDKDFIPLNADADGNLIEEEQGVYMKIRPSGFSMDLSDYEVKQSSNVGSEGGNDSYPRAYLDLFTIIESGIATEYPIPAGSSITLKLDSSFKYDAGWKHHIHEKEYFAQKDYPSLKQWAEELLINKYVPAIINEDPSDISNYGPNISVVRGYFTNTILGANFTETGLATDKMYLKVIGLESGGTRGRKGRIDANLVVRSSSGFFAFETEVKQADSEIYFETEQTFDIVNGNHQGNIQNQDSTSFTPAIIELDAFNCYAQGNGVESYKINDAFNANALNIDLRPSAASFEQYKEVRRYADLTYGEAYIESTNVNGLNEFNLSTLNFKELDKQFGSIQKLHSRDNDLLVLQEEKASKILFGKDALYNADGTSNPTSTRQVLGQQVTYLGENGIGKNPESFAENDYQIYYANSRRGLMQRLSIDGVTDIVEGMVDWFRDLFNSNSNSKKIGCYDPYLKQYVLSIDNEVDIVYDLECGNTIAKNNQKLPFSYHFNLNDLEGDIVLNYNISQGNATIMAVFNGIVAVASNVNGTGTLTIARNTMVLSQVEVTVTPVSEVISYEITNVCPLGIPMSVVSIIVNDAAAAGKTIINRYRWGSSPFFAENDTFAAGPVSRFSTATGIEGKGAMPKRGSIVNLQSFKDAVSSGSFAIDKCNRIGYLVSDTVYTDADIATISSLATFITVTEYLDGFFNKTDSANFLFNRTTEDEILYLIWDYTDRKPVSADDYTSTPKGTAKNIVILDNDSDPSGEELTVIILTGPEHGTAVLEEDNTITYTHDDSDTAFDSITYVVSNGICQSEPSTIHIDIAMACDESFAYSGGEGVFSYPISFGTATGECGISYDAFGIPDKFEIFWDGNLVATTTGLVSGTGTLLFEKTAAFPTSATIVITASESGTAWNIAGICPVSL